MELQATQLQEKWAPVLNSEDASVISDSHRRAVTAVLLENQEQALNEIAAGSSRAGGSSATGNIDNFDPVLISLVRRATPNLLAFDVAGVQPMKGPTGLIFAMKSNYADGTAGTDNTRGTADDVAPTEALFNEADTSFSGSGSAGSGKGMTTATAEGDITGTMGFEIAKTSVEAKSRQLKANYTQELAQDLKAVHGLSAETELANILSTEILHEINREMIQTMNVAAKVGMHFNATVGATASATVSVSDGRWEVEVYKALITHIEKEANQIAIDTRRGKGNFAIIGPGVAAALNATGSVQYGNTANVGMEDVNGNLFLGTLNGIKLYVDPFGASGTVTIGYKGSNAYDAGIFYCPYVPLSMMKTIGEDDFQPRIGFKTRYGMATNPFASASAASNVYYRRFNVTGL
jgi:hypothetical protein